MIKAVPMRYADVTFRSTLEADWAATFDEWRMKWSYEPIAVEFDDGTRYRADFYLTEHNVWVEVKGPHNERIEKPAKLHQAIVDPVWVPGEPYGLEPLVVVARVPERGCAVWEGVGGETVTLRDCPSCRYSCFIAWSGDWRCRICRTHGKPRDDMRSGDPLFHCAPRDGRVVA